MTTLPIETRPVVRHPKGFLLTCPGRKCQPCKRSKDWAIALRLLWHPLTLASFQVRCLPTTIFLVRGNRLPGSYPAQSRSRQKLYQMRLGKLPYSKPPGRFPCLSGVTKPDKMETKPDIDRTLADKNRTKILSPHAQNVLKCPFCPVFPAFPDPQLRIGLRRGPAAARQ